MSRRTMVILTAAVTWAALGIFAGNVYAQSETPQAEKFVLSGLVYVEGGRGLAWLQEPTYTKDQVVVVRVGDSVGPYRLTRILDDQVELEGPGGKVSIPLAGTGGAVSVASIPESVAPRSEGASQPVNPEVIIVERGDPRRNFPAADLLIGAGAQLTGEQPAPPPTMPKAGDRGIVPSSMQVLPPPITHAAEASAAAQSLTPASGSQRNPSVMVIPRGDPRREFPASTLLIGAGAQVGR